METYVAKNDSSTMLSNSLLIMGFGLALSLYGSFYGGLVAETLNMSFTVMAVVCLVLKLALLFTSGMWTKINGLNVVLFSVFTLLWGLTLYPILAIALSSEVWMQVATSAFLGASGLFVVMGLIGHTTKTDLTKFAGIAMWALIAIIIVSLINIFFNMPLISLAVSGISVILFSFFTAHDIQSIKNGHFSNAFEAGINLYIDFINLFTSLFHIIWSFMWGDE